MDGMEEDEQGDGEDEPEHLVIFMEDRGGATVSAEASTDGSEDGH